MFSGNARQAARLIRTEASLKKIFPFLFLFILLIASCGSSSVLILTDPHWEYFNNQLDKGYPVVKYWAFYKKGLVPDFETYKGEDREFPLWFNSLLEKNSYSHIVTTPSFRDSVTEGLPDFVESTVVMGEVNSISLDNTCQIISQKSKAFAEAGRIMKENWLEKNSTPIAVIWKGSENFELEYEALLESWGSDRAILEKNIFVFDKTPIDAEGKLVSFYNRYNFQLGNWTILAAAEPFLSEILKTWPMDENISGILMSPRHEYLPENIMYLITKNNREMLAAAASLVKSGEKGIKVSVEALFINR